MIPEHGQALQEQLELQELRNQYTDFGWRTVEHLAAEAKAGAMLTWSPDQRRMGPICKDSRERMLREAIKEINSGSWRGPTAA